MMGSESESQNNGLIVFLKNPIPGKAKTRIAKDVGEEKAHEIYLSLLSIARNILRDLHCKIYAFYSDFIDHEDEWSSDLYNKMLQAKGSLGVKMKIAFDDILTKHDKVCIIGVDCPYLTKDLIAEAFQMLDDSDAVIGPSQDGGYYLLGMKEAIHSIFEDIDWSTDQVLQQTINKLTIEGKKYSLLKRLSDIDHIEDWEAYRAFASV